MPALRAGRRSTLVQAPLGVVGIVVRDGIAWAGPLLEVGRRAARRERGPARPGGAARRRADAVRVHRAGPARGLFHSAGTGGLEHVVALDPPPAKGTMLVLEGAPLDRAVTGALWAAFAGGRPAAAPRSGG